MRLTVSGLVIAALFGGNQEVSILASRPARSRSGMPCWRSSAYPDPNDTANIGAIRGQILPANPFALAALTATSTGLSGWVGTQVVALDADTGAIVAAAFSSGSCNAASPPNQFDGTYDLERLPVGRNYNLYAGSLAAIALPSDFDVPADLCSQDGTPSCVAPRRRRQFQRADFAGVTVIEAVWDCQDA